MNFVNNTDKPWLKKYNLAKEYYINNGDLLIPSRYEISGVKLGEWIRTQRKNYKNNKLSKEKIKFLNDIGMVWSQFDNQWQENYDLAKKYFLKNGNLLIPERYEINGVKLGKWIHSQRSWELRPRCIRPSQKHLLRQHP